MQNSNKLPKVQSSFANAAGTVGGLVMFRSGCFEPSARFEEQTIRVLTPNTKHMRLSWYGGDGLEVQAYSPTSQRHEEA